MKNVRNFNGLTLLELMVVIAIIGILAVVGAPAFTELVKDNRAASQTREIVALLTFARSEALRSNSAVHVILREDGAEVCTSITCVDGSILRQMRWDRVAVDPQFQVQFTNRGYVDPFLSRTFRLEHENCKRRAQARELELERTGQLTVELAPCSN